MNNFEFGKKTLLSICTIALTTLLTVSFAAGEYFGFDSYEAYLSNYYSQERIAASSELVNIPTRPEARVTVNAVRPKTIQPVTVFTATPNTTNTQVTSVQLEPTLQTTNYYNGFSSYEAYLNNYYATIGGSRNVTPEELLPMQTTTCLSADDILKTDVEGQYLSCDGTLYTVARNIDVAETAPQFSVNYTIQYDQISETTPDLVGFTPVYVYPEQTPEMPRTETVEPVAPVTFKNVQALDFEVGNSYTFDSELNLSVLEINDNRCFAGQYCAQAGEVVAKFRIDFRNERNLLTVRLEPGQEPEINFLLANTSIKFLGIKYDQVTRQPLLQSVVQSR